MVLQGDKGTPSPFDTGLPRVQTSEDVPRWLVALGLVAAITLVVALLRYAVDLLGVVFLIILVGFSIRTVSDWLTEGETVSGWALAAVLLGLLGTVMVGLWLFGSRDVTAGYLENQVPSPLVGAVGWLEEHGWGQRVLLGGGGAVLSRGSTPGGLTSSAPPGQSSSGGSPSSASAPSPRRAGGATSGSSDGSAAATSANGSGHTSAPRASPRPARPSAAPDLAPPAAPPSAPVESAPSVATETTLASSQRTSVVGTSVRFTATVKADGPGPLSGIVVFYDGSMPLGTLTVRPGPSDTATAVLSTLALGIGTHEISAEFHGGHGFENSRSASLTLNVTRH